MLIEYSSLNVAMADWQSQRSFPESNFNIKGNVSYAFWVN
uniref:Uncharacterized protein n=1 Tax=Manihot esculenta TaxID=3983 RepID=A0A2C9U4G9_MANES